MQRVIVQSNEQLEIMVKTLSQPGLLIGADVEATDINIQKLRITGLGLGSELNAYYVPFPNKLTPELIVRGLERIFKANEVVFHNAKYDLQVFEKYGFPIPERFHDTLIMSWLYDENTPHGLKYLAKNLLGKEEVKAYNKVNQQVDLFHTEEDVIKELGNYCMDDVDNTLGLFRFFEPKLKEQELMKDYTKIELPMIHVLRHMEYRGIRLDLPWLKEKQKELQAIVDGLEKDLTTMTGGSMNLRSPMQLEEYLFTNLGYEPTKVTQGGKKSTDNESLEHIIKKYELTKDDFVPKLLEFRDLDKILTTYVIALQEQADEDGVIHASFLQHGTKTGRLSSRDPNLQNIPSRSDEWNVRKVFIPREGCRFVIADYSQVELRVLAHFSQDKAMVDTFLNDGDIHAKTMELTHTPRRIAKAINFGLIYGMGPRKLAETVGEKESEAKEYIERFFKGFPETRAFIYEIQRQALNRGFVSMITGRKRRFYEYRDNKWFGTVKRQSINTKIQGSAADLIKIAMIKMMTALKEYDAHILIQIHDEVIVECPEEHLEKVKDVVKTTMENAVKLRVPLKVGMVDGDHWVKG